jgi:anti-sigma B factor antagonist
MISRQRTVTVKQLPAKLDIQGRKTFYRALQGCINEDRPRLVFDCRRLRELDPPAIHFLLCCLEEAMKRNGDVKLAVVAPEAQTSLESAGADRIFEIFETLVDAVDSYTQRPVRSISQDSIGGSAAQAA